ncbi:RNA exonuclease 3 [Trapelia coarctata]|nr:RNA exonuclease 3 [Trapelia coarctata]
MFSSIGLFTKIVCPEFGRCRLPGCLYLHDEAAKSNATQSSAVSKAKGLGKETEDDFETPPTKRRRTDSNYERPATLPTVSSSSTGSTASTPNSHPETPHRSASTGAPDEHPPRSVKKGVSPPPLRKQSLAKGHSVAAAKTKAPKDAKPKESLNPRMLKKPPAIHAVRLKLLTLIHEQMVRLNKDVQASKDASRDALELSEQELIRQALKEEYDAALDNPMVYANILKLRIVALKKMTLADWKKERLKQIAKDFPEVAPPKPSTIPVTIATGLSSVEEIALLPKLVAVQEGLSKHGYIVTSPSEADIEQARKGVEASQGWEECDRCKSRFQVFPGRRESDGALTSGGKCTYHYGKPRRPVKEKADTGHKDTVYTCCNQTLGTPGCTTAESHVFKVSEAKRLALIMPFKGTIDQGPRPPDHAVCFDCEMGYTTQGLELIRLTATSWPDGEELLDVLVRPIGEVLDLNSRFSGVWPTDYGNSVPYSADAKVSQDEQGSGRRLPLVNSPDEARELLLAHLTTTTPLIGHAIENDLNSTRIIHPTIIDTVLLYPHPRGLPIRYGLKMLVRKYLNKDIQMGGAQGHDSKEDARAAGELVLLKVMETWKSMKAEGWSVKSGDFHPPLPGGPPPSVGSKIIVPGAMRLKRAAP